VSEKELERGIGCCPSDERAVAAEGERTDFRLPSRPCYGDEHRADWSSVLLGRARDSRRRRGPVGAEQSSGAPGHRRSTLGRHRAVTIDQSGVDPENRRLDVGGVRREPAT
jgi:hypothetical protein